jgi:ribosomal protein L12E/L44/L45/RPP1/RPP2
MMSALLYAALGLVEAGTPVTASNLRSTLEAMGTSCPEMEMVLLERLATRLAEGSRMAQCPTQSALGAGTGSKANHGAAPEPRVQMTDERKRGAEVAEAPDSDLLYVYAVVPAHPPWPGGTGIGGQEVFAVVEQDVAALVHRQPLHERLAPSDETLDMIQVAAQATAHEAVVMEGMTHAGSVLPLRLNMLVHGGAERDATSALRGWLVQTQDQLKGRLDALRGMAEYAVVVRYHFDVESSDQAHDVETVTRQMADMSPNLQRLYRHKLERALRDQQADWIQRQAQAVRDALSPLCADVREQPLERLAEGDDDVLLRLALLLPEGHTAEVGEALDGLAGRPGLSIRFTGPWPPYSFADALSRVGNGSEGS